MKASAAVCEAVCEHRREPLLRVLNSDGSARYRATVFWIETEQGACREARLNLRWYHEYYIRPWHSNMLTGFFVLGGKYER